MFACKKGFQNSMRDFRDSIERLREPYTDKDIIENFIRHAESITFPDELHILTTDFFNRALTSDRSCKQPIRGEFLGDALKYYAKTHQIYDRWEDSYSKVDLSLSDLETLLLLVHGFLGTYFKNNAFMRFIGVNWCDDRYDLEFTGMRWTRQGYVILANALTHQVPPFGSFWIKNSND